MTLFRTVVNVATGQSQTVELSAEEEASVLAARAAANAPTIGQVIAERTRRLAMGFDYDFGDGRGVHRIGTTEADMRGWDEVAKASAAFVALGNSSAEITIVTDTGPAVITALEFQAILAAAAAHRQPIWAASFSLQAMDPIPDDFAAEIYWA